MKMDAIKVLLSNLETTPLRIGRVGENLHTQVQVNCMSVFLGNPNATVALTVQPPTGDAYPAVVEKDGVIVTWEITASDLISEGNGRIQMTFTDGEEVIKTVIGSTVILPSIEPTGTAPTPIENWIVEAGTALEQIQEVVETVTGSTPSIVGVANHRYVCGEVASISITPPESGVIDVVFSSGSTAATLTVPDTVVFPAWFDRTALQANATYEINIADGLGVVAVWA